VTQEIWVDAHDVGTPLSAVAAGHSVMGLEPWLAFHLQFLAVAHFKSFGLGVERRKTLGTEHDRSVLISLDSSCDGRARQLRRQSEVAFQLASAWIGPIPTRSMAFARSSG